MARFNLAQQNENVYSFPQSITTDTVNLVSPQAELTVISLENARGSHALLSNVGCALLSLEIGGVDVVLGYDTPAQYLDDEFYLGVVVGPVAGPRSSAQGTGFTSRARSIRSSSGPEKRRR